MSRPRSTENIIHAAHVWLGSYPGLIRMESVDKSAEEKAELASYAAAIARVNSRLWQRWQRKHHERDAEKEQQVSSLKK
jgi:hypothetical protein